MNARQQVALRAGPALLLVMALVPPWRGRVVLNNNIFDVKAGYAFLLPPPREGVLPGDSRVSLEDRTCIDFPLLAAQWVVVASATTLAISFLQDRRVP